MTLTLVLKGLGEPRPLPGEGRGGEVRNGRKGRGVEDEKIAIGKKGRKERKKEMGTEWIWKVRRT